MWVFVHGAVLVGSARQLFQLDLTTDVRSWNPLEDGVPRSTNAMVVLSRHADPRDSLLLMNTLMNREYLRRPRVVLKGGYFTPKRRTRAIQRLSRAGHAEAAARAEQLKHVLPPRPAGVLAALDSAPYADVVVVTHTGMDHIVTPRDIWREIPVHKNLLSRWTFVPAADIPVDRDQSVAWLNDHWSDIDRWVDANNA